MPCDILGQIHNYDQRQRERDGGKKQKNLPPLNKEEEVKKQTKTHTACGGGSGSSTVEPTKVEKRSGAGKEFPSFGTFPLSTVSVTVGFPPKQVQLHYEKKEYPAAIFSSSSLLLILFPYTNKAGAGAHGTLV